MSEFVITPEIGGRAERIFLNPEEVATADRIERNLHSEAICVGEEGIDWGQQEINAFMVQRRIGAIPIDSELPNRVITIPLSLGLSGDFDEARIALQAEVGRINEEGGTLKRELIGGTYGEAGSHLFADIVKATLKLGGGTYPASNGVDPDAELILEALPDSYGDLIEEPAFEGTGDASETFQIKGNLPGRVDLTVTDKSSNDQLGLGYHFRCRNYSDDEGAAWAYEAEDLTPLDLATITTLSGASPSGSSANNVVQHNNLGTSWTPVLSTNRPPKVRAVAAAKAGTGAITPPLPAGVKENYILVMFIETENQAVTAPAGWAQIVAPGVAAGTPTRLTVLWKRASASETAPTIEDPGDHVIARIMAVSGCIKTGNPWNVFGQGTEETSDTSVEWVSITTSVDQCLVLTAVSTGTDVSSSAHISGWTNANLQALTERMDSWTAEGGGGGFGVASGVKLKAGAIGATTATVGTANFKAQVTIALKPETGGNVLNHVGFYDVWARVYTTSEEPPWLRFIYDVGDLVAPVENMAFQVPGSKNFYLVPLGQLNLQRVPIGPPRWGGVIQARGAAGGESVTIDRLYLFDANEASGILTGTVTLNIGLSGTKVRDEFNQTPAGVLNEKELPDGSGNWTTSGSAKGDFEVASGVITRAVKSDIEPRYAKSPLTGGPFSLLAMQFSFEWSAVPTKLENLSSTLFSAVGSKIISAENIPGVGSQRINQLRIIGKFQPIPVTFQPGVTYVLTLLFAGKLGLAIAYVDGMEVGRGTSAESLAATLSNVWLGDYNGSEQAITRTYDDFMVWVPDQDPVTFANGTTRLTSDGMFRADSAGIGFGAVAYPGADLPRIPVSGPEGRPVEVAVKPSRGDFGDFSDSGLDKAAPQLSYRPCWSGVPES